ncbi:MAG: UbiA family prenyltransferase [Crocinitomicaceae bacterium]|nr:UbiA family prenyltransferase [Crocinitomicaceae bacterium]
MLIQKVKDFLTFIRWFHSLLALLPFVSIYLFLINDPGFHSCRISTIDFFVICIGVEAILISGVILNDLVDTGIDRINKLEKRSIERTISKYWAKMYFWLFTFIVIGISIYIAQCILRDWVWIGTGAYLISVLYNLYLKRLPLIGNIAMASLARFVPLVIPILVSDSISNLENDRIEVLIYVYASLVFMITIPRELTLDLSDINGDNAFGYRTLPILVGARVSKYVAALFVVSTIILSLMTIATYQHLTIPLIILDLGSLRFLYGLPQTSSRSGYIKICRQLWLTMIIGMIGSTIATAS